MLKTIRINIALLSSGLSAPVLLLSVLFLATPHPAFAETRTPLKYKAEKIQGGLSARPGILSWASDNRRLAYTGERVYIYDTAGREQKSLNIKNPFFVSWGTGSEIFILYKEAGRKALCRADAESLKTDRVNLDMEPDAVFPVISGKKLLVLSSRTKPGLLWTELSYSLYIHDLKNSSTRELYSSARNLPVKNISMDYLSGWIMPGTSPSDAISLTMEYIKPPAANPYLKIGSVDYITGKAKTIGRLGHRKFSVPGSWSPDGRRFVLPGEDNHLLIFDLSGSDKDLDNSIHGTYPAWNPKGSQIFFGGYILNSDGTGKEELFPADPAGMAIWSPDGTKMALLSNSELWLFDGFIPYYIEPDKPADENMFKKTLLLKELLWEGLLAEGEYEERFNRLLKEKENFK